MNLHMKCPQCGKEMTSCKPMYSGRLMGICMPCDVLVTIEGYQAWVKKMQAFHAQKVARNASYAGAVSKSAWDEKKSFAKETKPKPRPFNPTER